MLLSPEDAALFFKLMWGLQFYVNQQTKLLPDVITLDAYVHLPSKEKVVVRDAMWQNPAIIAAFVQDNHDRLSPDERELVLGWQRFVTGTFQIMRYLKQYTVFVGESNVYGVLGLFDHFSQMFPGRPLPIMVETVLLPFKGRIVYDGICKSYNVSFGSGIRSHVEEEYRTAKQNGKIIVGLDPEAAMVAPPTKHRKLALEAERIVAEIVAASEHLDGGTAVQSASFAVLRVSAKAVQAAIQSPDNLDALWRAAPQISRALTRMQKAMERAEK